MMNINHSAIDVHLLTEGPMIPREQETERKKRDDLQNRISLIHQL